MGVLRLPGQPRSRGRAVEPPRDGGGDACGNRRGGSQFSRRGRPPLQLRQHGRAPLAAHFDHETVAAVIEQFGQRQVVAGLHLRPGRHGGAETGRGRLSAIDGHDEGALAPLSIIGIGKGAVAEYAILDRHGVQFAGAHPHQRQRRADIAVAGDHLEGTPLAPGLKEQRLGREQLPLPGVGARVMGKQRTVPAGCEAIVARLLLVAPADGQRIKRGQLAVDDSVIADHRPHHPVLPPQHHHQRIEVAPLDHDPVANRCSAIGHVCFPLLARPRAEAAATGIKLSSLRQKETAALIPDKFNGLHGGGLAAAGTPQVSFSPHLRQNLASSRCPWTPQAGQASVVSSRLLAAMNSLVTMPVGTAMMA